MKHMMLFKFIIVFSNLLAVCLGQCSTVSDCFTCSDSKNDNQASSKYCEWTGTRCQNGASSSFDPFYNQYSYCTDSYSENLRSIYCGTSQYTSNDEEVIFSMPSNSGLYGRASVLCKYVYLNKDKKSYVFLNVKVANGLFNQINMMIKAKSYDGSVSERYVENSNFLVRIQECEETTIYYVAKQGFNEAPFAILAKTEKPGLSVTLIVTIVLIVAACIICSVSVWIFSKRIAQRNALAQQRINMYQAGIRMNPGETEEMVKKRKMNQLQMLLNSCLMSRLYEKDLAKYNLNCTICFEEYNKTSNVCLTECKHVFHYECIKSWLTKNLLNPKCPNCNFMILPEQIENGSSLEGVTQSIPFTSTRSGNRNTRTNVVNNFVENGGGVRNNISTNLAMRTQINRDGINI